MSENEYERMWSVTTLLKSGTPNDHLVQWAANQAAQLAIDSYAELGEKIERDPIAAHKWLKMAHRRTSKKAAGRGTDLHSVIEALGLGVAPPDHDLPHVRQIERFFAEWEPQFDLSEATVYHLRLKYAGTLDGVVRLMGERAKLVGLYDKPLLFDAKTTDKSINHDGALPPYPEVALQMTAYGRCDVVGLQPPQMKYAGGRRYYLWHPSIPHEPVPEVEGAVALAVFPDGYRLHPVQMDDDTWRAFLAVREVARWKLATSKRVIAPYLNAPLKEAA